jgi:hypothetical protein
VGPITALATEVFLGDPLRFSATYLVLRLLVRSGFINSNRDWNVPALLPNAVSDNPATEELQHLEDQLVSRGAKGVECYCFLEGSDSDENELRESDHHFGERGCSWIGGLGIFGAAAILIAIQLVEHRRASFSAMASFYDWKSAVNAAVSNQMHGVLNPLITFFSVISEISC